MISDFCYMIALNIIQGDREFDMFSVSCSLSSSNCSLLASFKYMVSLKIVDSTWFSKMCLQYSNVLTGISENDSYSSYYFNCYYYHLYSAITVYLIRWYVLHSTTSFNSQKNISQILLTHIRNSRKLKGLAL